MQGAVENRSYYADIPTFQIAFAGWLTGDDQMLGLAHDEVMALVNENPTGDQGRGTKYQHVENRVMMVAGTADLAYDYFSSEELTLVANWVNGTLENWNHQNTTYWPWDEPRNNFWQNGFLAHVIAGIATRDFNPRAAEWRALTEEMAAKWIETTTPPLWQGPVQSEGHYYAAYVGNVLWGMQLYDAAQGTNFLNQSGFNAEEYLELLMFQTRPHLKHFFLVGSEANASDARHTGLAFRYWHQLIHLAGEDSQRARHAKNLLQVADDTSATYIGRNVRGFANFYWNIGSVASEPLDTKAERLYAAPTPGAGLIGLRSSLGFQIDACAAIMFANNFSVQPAFDHGNPDAPGFQWACGDDWIVTDPDFFHNSGILAEAGSGVLSDISNIVTLDSQKANNAGDYPRIRHAENNLSSAIPHFYISIDAAPYWTHASHYQRDYVWLGDELKALVIFDRVDSPSQKKWRLHIPVEPEITDSQAIYSVGGRTIRIRDLNGEGWNVENLGETLTVRDVWRLYQEAPEGDYRSVKVLDIDNLVLSASLDTDGSEYQVSLLTNQGEVTVRFMADGTRVQL